MLCVFPCSGVRRGAVVVLAAVFLVVLIGFAALAIDIGTVMLARCELQRTADAAALAAASQVPLVAAASTKTDAMRTAAVEYAAKNHVLGRTLKLDPERDVEIGYFDSTTSTWLAGITPANGVRVTARRTSTAESGPVPLFLMDVFGKHTADVAAQATVLFHRTCYSAGIRARDVQIAASAVLDGICIHGLNRVHVAAQATVPTSATLSSTDISNITFGGDIPENLTVAESTESVAAADNVTDLINGLETGDLLDSGLTTDVINPLLNLLDEAYVLDLNDLLPNTTYIINGNTKITGGDVSLENVTIAVRGDIKVANGTILRNAAEPGPGATALGVLATGSVYCSNAAGLHQVELIAGGDVSFASDAEMFSGSIVAGGKVNVAAKFFQMTDAYATRYQNVEGTSHLVLAQ